MGKYDFSLDLEHENSLTMLISHIASRSHILEIGPANGRLTRYLQEQMNCKIDIVELDADSGRQAAAYAERSCLGPIEGDIEQNVWCEKLSGQQYDYIVFADVLEHLRAPGEALKKCSNLLADDGVILVSVPNVAHNALILGLMNDQFQYTKIGLLDNTHVHLFTYQSFLEMIKDIGYQVISVESVVTAVGAMEVRTDYSMVDRDVARCLKGRTSGEVYQYIFQFGKQEGTQEDSVPLEIKPIPKYFCECYVKEGNNEKYASPRDAVRHFFCVQGNEYQFSFALDEFSAVNMIRIDPLNVNGIFDVEDMKLYDDSGQELSCGVSSNGLQCEGKFFFETDDPQIYLHGFSGKLDRVVIRYRVELYETDAIEYLKSSWKKNTEKIQQMHKKYEIKEQQYELKEQQYHTALTRISQLQQQYDTVVEKISQLQQQYNTVVAKINQIESTFGYRSLEKLRKFRKKF